MQRQLIVLRHAKSSWADSGLSDHERPLNNRGLRDAPRVAQRLNELGWQPQYLLSSDARRTRETSKLMLAVWEDGIPVEYLSSLYLAGPKELRDALSTVSDEVESLMVVGHNPGWEHVVHKMSGVNVVMKTATAALLTADCESWADSYDLEWTMKEIVYPRDL